MKVEDFSSDQLFSIIAWYFGIPIFVGLQTELKWGVLTFVIVTLLLSLIKHEPKGASDV